MKILFVSLGCDKNLADTEKMMGLLGEKGYSFTDDEAEADIVVVNTCCFIGDAKEESIQTLLEFADARERGQIRALVAAGCLAQRYREEIQEEIPQVDALVGTNSLADIVQAVCGAPEHKPESDTAEGCAEKGGDSGFATSVYCRSLLEPPYAGGPRVLTTGGHYAYLKIAEGCGKFCTYCVIPHIRGPYRSIPEEALLKEAGMLAEQGVKELILVAQETTLYGADLYGEKRLPQLLKKLAQIEGLVWIRLLYCYPEEVTQELLDVIAAEPKICHYLDIPIQHASDDVLRRMGRRTCEEELREKIAFIRDRIPDVCLRTTLISGFPGETQEDFEELYRFVNEMEFDRLGVFPYSQEEGTPAGEMADQISQEVKESRRDELMELQQEIVFEKASDWIGKELLVLIEGKVADEDVYVGRTYRDAPGVDGYLFVNTTASLMTGDFVRVLVTDCHEYDLLGEPV